MSVFRLNQSWIKVAFSLVLMVLLLIWVGPLSIWNTIKTSRPELILVSLFFTPIVIGIKTLRWFLLVRTQSPISFQAALRSYLAGITLATLTPLAAGEVGRGLFVRIENRAGLTGKVALDKLIDLSTVAIFAAAGLILTGESAVRTVGLAIIIGVGLVWAGILVLLPRFAGTLSYAHEGVLAYLRLPAIINGLAGIPRPRLILNMLLSLVGFIIFYGQAFVLLLAFWQEASWTVVPYFPVITLSTILPIAIGGVGIREWTAILLLSRFGVTESAAFNAFFIHFIVVQVIPALAGAAIIGSFRRTTGFSIEQTRRNA